MSRKVTYTLDEVLVDMFNFENLLPFIDYDNFKDKVFYFKYSDYYLEPIGSNYPLSLFQIKVVNYIRANNRLSWRYYYALIKIKRLSIKKSLAYKRFKSRVLRKRVKIKENHWTT